MTQPVAPVYDNSSHPARLMASFLVSRYHTAAEPTTITWLNHYSVGLAEPEILTQFDVVAVDGTLLAVLLGHAGRSSADSVLPMTLPRLAGARLLLIGGDIKGRGTERALAPYLAPGASVVGELDGFDGLLRGEDLVARIGELGADVVIIGLGGGLQERVGLEAAKAPGVRLVVTCGGFLDQVVVPQYYPRWAYPLRLNWAVRLWREPRRLWRRYTVVAADVVSHPARISWVRNLRGFRTNVSLLRRGVINHVG